MALGKLRTSINVRGGGLLKTRELIPAPTDGWSDLGYIQSTQVADTHTMVDAQDERGLMIDWIDGGQGVVISGNLMQSAIDEVTFFKTLSLKYHDLYYYVPLANGQFMEVVAIGRFKPGFTLAFAAATLRALPFEFHCLPAKIALTRAPTTFNFAINDMYVVTQNASAQNAPTDTATSVAAAI